MKKRNMKYMILLPLLLLTVACGGNKQNETTNTADTYCLDEEFKAKITLNSPTPMSMQKEIHLSGVVEPKPDNIIQFSNLVDGIITKTHFQLGDYVKKGQVLAEMKSMELTEWKTREQLLKAEIKLAQQDLAATQSLYNDGVSSQRELLKAENEVSNLEAELAEISSNLELYNASSSSPSFLIKAQRSGYIIEKNIAPGMQVEAFSNPFFTIAELDEVWVQINIYTSDIKHIQRGMEVKIQSLSHPDQEFTGKIEAIAHVLDENSRVIKARVNLPNPDLILKPGMFVDVMAFQESEEKVLAIPLSAVIFDNNKNHVILYEDDCNLKIQEIQSLGQRKDVFYIDTNALQATDKIVTKEQLLIYEQLKNF